MNNGQNNTFDYKCNNGIILKLDNDKALAMTDKLDFVTLKIKPGMEQGQKVIFNDYDLYKPSIFSRLSNVAMPTSIIAAAAAVILIIFFSIRLALIPQEYAYISLDINPSLELVIGKNENVIEAKAFNSEAQTVIDETNVQGLQVYDAVKIILDNSKEKGYLNSFNNLVLISASLNSKHKKDFGKDKSVEELLNSCKEIADSMGIDCRTISSTPESRSEAYEEGLSMGRYAVYNEAKSIGIDIDIEEVKTSSITEILNKLEDNSAILAGNTENSGVEPKDTGTAASTPKILATSIPEITPVSHTNTSEVSMVVTPTSSKSPLSTASTDATPAPTVEQSTVPTPIAAITPTKSSESTKAPIHTPTNKPVALSSPTPAKTPVYTPAHTPSKTSSVSTPHTSTKTPVKTPSHTPSKTSSVPPSHTTVKTPAHTPPKTPNVSPSYTPTNTPVYTPAHTPTHTPVVSPSPTPTKTPVYTPAHTPTHTPVVSPSHTPTKTPVYTPVHTPTHTPEPTQAGPEIKLELKAYNHIRAYNSKEIQPRIKLTNKGDSTINLADIKIRYYYTKEQVINQKYTCDWANINNSKITGKIVEMSDPKENADCYVEIGFVNSAGSLGLNESIEIISRIGNSYALDLADPPYAEWNYMYDQSNDYSFNRTSSDFVRSVKITVYIAGDLYWGIEP